MKTDVPSKRKGFALIFVMAFAAIITIFTASVGAQASYNLRLAENRSEVDRAYYAAQTGTQLILALLREPPPVFDYDDDGVARNWLDEDASVSLNNPNTQSKSIARVYHNIEGFSHAQAIAPDGTAIPPNHFYIISLGVVNGVYDADGNLQDGAKVQAASMGATLNPEYPILPQAIFAYDTVNVDGDVAHFNSKDPAPWAVADGGSGGDHMQSNVAEASVGVNSPNEANMNIGANAKINGHVLLGFGATPTNLDNEAGEIRALSGGPNPQVGATLLYGQPGTQIGNPGEPHVSGSVDALSNSRAIPDMAPEVSEVEEYFSAGAGGTLNLDEGKLYVKQGDLSLSAGSTINVLDSNGDGETEDAILLVEKDITFDGVTIGANGVTAPRTLKIYSLGAGSTFTMKNNSTAYCLVAGADMAVNINTGSVLWGAVLGREVTLEDNSAIHFDVTLRDPTLIADIYGYYLVGANVSPGASVATGAMGPVGGTAAPAPAPAAGAGLEPAPAPAPAPSGGGGCGCGCGCGSMLMMEKEMAAY